MTADSTGPFVGLECSDVIASIEPGETVTQLCLIEISVWRGPEYHPGCVDLTLTVDPPLGDADPSNDSITETFKYDVNQCP